MNQSRRRHPRESVLDIALWTVLLAVLVVGLSLALRTQPQASAASNAECEGMERRSGLGFIGLLVDFRGTPDPTTEALRVGAAFRAEAVHRSGATCVFEMDGGALLTARGAEVVFTSTDAARLEKGQLSVRNGRDSTAFLLTCQGQEYQLGPSASLHLKVTDPESHRGTVLAGPIRLPSRPDLDVQGPLETGQRLAFKGGIHVMRPSGNLRDPTVERDQEATGVVSTCGLLRFLRVGDKVPVADTLDHDYILLTADAPAQTTSRLDVDINTPGRYFVQNASDSVSHHVPPDAFIEADYASAVAPNVIKSLPSGSYRAYFVYAQTASVREKNRRLRGKIRFSRPVAGLVTSEALLSKWRTSPAFASDGNGLDFDGVVLSEDRRTVELDLLPFDQGDSLRILVRQ